METIFSQISVLSSMNDHKGSGDANPDKPIHVADNGGLLSTVITADSCRGHDEVRTPWPQGKPTMIPGPLFNWQTGLIKTSFLCHKVQQVAG